MVQVLEAVVSAVGGILHAILNRLLLFKIWIQERFAPITNTQSNEEFTILEIVFYKNDNCEGYHLDASLFGVTSWTDIYHAVNEQYDNILRADELPEARLDIRYTLFGQRYHVVYQYGLTPEVVYPPYTVEEVRRYLNSSTMLVPIIHAESAGEDVTDLVQEYAGPKGNFYEDCKTGTIKSNWIRPINLTGELVITNGNCREYQFGNGVRISLSDHPFTPHIGPMSAILTRAELFASNQVAHITPSPHHVVNFSTPTSTSASAETSASVSTVDGETPSSDFGFTIIKQL